MPQSALCAVPLWMVAYQTSSLQLPQSHGIQEYKPCPPATKARRSRDITWVTVTKITALDRKIEAPDVCKVPLHKTLTLGVGSRG